jgi:hypothetical protein
MRRAIITKAPFVFYVWILVIIKGLAAPITLIVSFCGNSTIKKFLDFLDGGNK